MLKKFELKVGAYFFKYLARVSPLNKTILIIKKCNKAAFIYI